MPWEKLVTDFPRARLTEINETMEEWRSLCCRICRLVRSIAELHESTPVVRLNLEWSGIDYGASYVTA